MAKDWTEKSEMSEQRKETTVSRDEKQQLTAMITHLPWPSQSISKPCAPHASSPFLIELTKLLRTVESVNQLVFIVSCCWILVPLPLAYCSAL